MKLKISGLLVSFFCCFKVAFSQQNLFPNYCIPIVHADTLHNAFSGGLNSPIFAELEINGTPPSDLLVYEKTTTRILTFINTGTAGQSKYDYVPQYENLIPPLSEWVRTYDYDCDGDLDIFTYTYSYTFTPLGEGATSVYRNDYTVGTGLQFTPVANELLTAYNTILSVVPSSPANLPGFMDVDGDDDMDILTFSSSSNYLEYHINYIKDSTGSCAGFMFHADPDCWGQFRLSGVANIGILNNNCQGNVNRTLLHSGSALMLFDMGCDNDIDLVNGDILGTNLLYLENGGTSTSSFITYQDSLFPSYDSMVDYDNLPSPYYIDVDNDGAKDMLVAAFATVGEDYNNVLFYKNITDNCTNQFQFQQSRFLVEEMIDVGTASTPVFFDADADGLMDIIVGNDFYYSTNSLVKVGKLAFYKNTGTITQPVFTLMSSDYANVSSLGILGAYPAFGDLDGDTDKDMLLGNVNGDLIYYQNTAGAGNPANFVFTAAQYQGIDIGSNSMPQIIDVDRDSFVDLLIGERSGVLNYYRNTNNNTSPLFALQTSNFGGVNVIKSGAIQGSNAPVLFDNNGNYELLVGSESGYIYHYNNIDGNLAGNFTLLDSTYEDILELRRATISRYDIDADNTADLIVGNQAGGLRFYSGVSCVTSIKEESLKEQFDVYPNPALDFINIMLKDKSKISGMEVTICDISGRRIVAQTKMEAEKIIVPLQNLSPGVYFIVLKNEPHYSVQKFIKL